ncbi:MAG: hypothetical protein JKY53_15090 [Flavobacteriales bacterium]|nr:hypothetical protein [Flavobacteriales bacterium]
MRVRLKNIPAKDMDLLDYNAIRFANIILSCINNVPHYYLSKSTEWAEKYEGYSIKECIAKESYELSEAMLKERENYIK